MGQFLSNILKHFNRFQRIKWKLVTYCPLRMASTISPCVLPLIPVIVGFSILKRTTLEIISFNLGFSYFCQRIYPYRHIHGGDKLLSIIFQ